MFICIISFSKLIEYLIDNKIVTVLNARRLATVVGKFLMLLIMLHFSHVNFNLGSYGPCVMLLLVTQAGCDTKSVIFILCCAVGLSGAVNSGFLQGFQVSKFYLNN